MHGRTCAAYWRRSPGASDVTIMQDNDTGIAAHAVEHDQVWSNLPWFINGTLANNEREVVEAHLSSCLVCRREAMALDTLQRTLASRSLDPLCEAALDRLYARIDASAADARVFPWAAAAVLLIVTGLAGVVAMNTSLLGSEREDNAYTTLGVRTTAVDDSDTVKARIVFARNVTEKQMRELLLGADAEVIDGPTPRGAYTIAMPRVTRADGLRAAVAGLRDSERVIFIEPIASAGAERRQH